MFFLERIPEIKKVFFGVGLSAESQKNIPLHEYYSPLMVAPGQQTNNKFDLKKALEDIRHNMTDQVCFCKSPFSTLLAPIPFPTLGSLSR